MVSEVSSEWQQLLHDGKNALNEKNFDAAKTAFEAALEQAYKNDAPEASVAEMFFQLGICLQYKQDYAGAEKRYKQALATVERAVGLGTPHSVAVMKQMLALYGECGKTAEADQIRQRLESVPTMSAQNLATTAPATSDGQTPLPGAQTPSNRPFPDPSTQPTPQPAAPPISAPGPKGSATQGASKTKREWAQTKIDNTRPDMLADYEQRLAAAGQRAKDEHIDVTYFVHPREKFYGSVASTIGVLFYLGLAISLIGVALAPIALLSAYIIAGVHYGALRSRGIRVSSEQFPEVYDYVEKYCTLMNMEIPEVFVVQEHGMLNAFAQRLHRRNMITIYSDVLELAYEQGEKELAFVVVHELTHLKCGHVKWHWLHLPAGLVPFLGHAYSRAREYTCDRVASFLVPDGALYGLVALAAGTKLYKRVNMKALYEQQEQDWCFWTWYHEITSTHPNLINRIRAIGLGDELASTNSSNTPSFSRSARFPHR